MPVTADPCCVSVIVAVSGGIPARLLVSGPAQVPVNENGAVGVGAVGESFPPQPPTGQPCREHKGEGKVSHGR